MINKVKHRFMLRPDTSDTKGGKYIYLYANVNGSKMFVSVGSSIPENSWNETDQSVKSGIANQRTINNKLAQIRIQINNLINRADSSGKSLTVQELKNIVSDGGNSDSFYLFMDKEIKRMNRSSGTIAIYKSRLNDLKKFKSDLKFSEITVNLWHEYEQYLANKGNNQKTISNAYIQTKGFINRAVELDLLTANPWAKIKVKIPKGNRKYLTWDELKKVEIFSEQTKIRRYKSLLHAFLFGCYTGLRFSDVKTITGLDISGMWINKKIKKSGKTESIPLNDKAAALLPKKLGKEKLFVFCGRNEAGKYLTAIMSELKINKKMTFHCARHTFATISLELTGNIALVQQTLGHATIQTTQIYAKILDGAKLGLMDKWNAKN